MLNRKIKKIDFKDLFKEINYGSLVLKKKEKTMKKKCKCGK